MRADLYNGLADALTSEDFNLEALGKKFILPSSFMVKLYQDAMAIVRHYGKPYLLIAFTANPKWADIQNELLPGQTAIGRPDIVARVFNLKVRQLLKDLKKKKGIFGRYKGLVRTIEYQKRGLPHVRLLLFLGNEHGKFDTSSHIDEIISAELPYKNTHPDLYKVVTGNMKHGPCGKANPSSPSMIVDAFGNKTCSKGFPKDYQPENIRNENGYPLYRRRFDGKSHVIRDPINRSHEYHMFNCWVVPYNPYLSGKYKAHINVEICGSIKAIKYVNKYIYKGSDKTTVEIENEKNDEIKKYLNGRYISPVEAMWKINEYPMHEEDSCVYQLPVHLPGEQPVVFYTDLSPAEVAHLLENTKSILMGFFSY